MASEIKPNYDQDREILANVVPLRTPYSIQITPSSRCNFKCNYCIHSSPEMNNKSLMKWNTFEKLCEQIGQFEDKVKQINFAGWGEPTINKDLPEMIAHIKQLNLAGKVSVITNGSLLNHNFALSLIESGVDSIRISLQGVTSMRYKEICGVQQDFNDLVDKIRYLNQHKGRCAVYVKVADISLSKEEESLFYSKFLEISDRMFVENIRPIFDDEKVRSDTNYSISKYGQVHPPVLVCPQPFFMLNISAEGDVFPCCSYYDPTQFGNINNTTLKDIWHSNEIFEFLKMMLRKERNTQQKYPVCNKCKLPDVVVLPQDSLDENADEIFNRFLTT